MTDLEQNALMFPMGRSEQICLMFGTLAHLCLIPGWAPRSDHFGGDADCSVAVVGRTMRSPVASRLFPIRERPPDHWSRVWLHGTHARPSDAQLRCRGAACEGGADASPRVDWSALLATHRTLISASADVLVARASCCCCSWCCMLPSARSPSRRRRPRHQQEALIAARGRLPFARPFEF